MCADARRQRRPHSAFTLIEVMVALSIFVSLILLSTMAFSHFQKIGEETRQVMNIHEQAGRLKLFLDQSIGRALPMAAIWQESHDNQHRLVFMSSLPPASPSFGLIAAMHQENLSSSANVVGISDFNDLDIVWMIIEINERGMMRYGDTPHPYYSRDCRFADDINATAYTTYGHRRPTLQRFIKHLVGIDGGSEAERVGPVNKRIGTGSGLVGNYTDIDGDGDAHLDYWRRWLGALYHEGTIGVSEPVSGSYAVRNPDGRSLNIDWLQLIGQDAAFAGTHDFENQRRPTFRNIEFSEITFLDDDLQRMASETDSLGDGNASLDWAGLPEGIRASDMDPGRRPSSMRFSCLLHDLPSNRYDDGDADNDGNYDELLGDALRHLIAADAGLTSQAQRQEAMRLALREHNYAAEIFTWKVDLP